MSPVLVLTSPLIQAGSLCALNQLALSPGAPISTDAISLSQHGPTFPPQRHLIEFCYTVAQKYLFEGRHEDAVPAALHSLRFRMNVHGLSSVELVPAYLLLAEASLGKRTQPEVPGSPYVLHWIISVARESSFGHGTKTSFVEEQGCYTVWHQVGKEMSWIFGYS